MVWLTLYSTCASLPKEIGEKVGLTTNVDTPRARVGEKGQTKSREQDFQTFKLHSDKEIDIEEPLEKHISWLVRKCRPHLPAIIDFLVKPDNWGHVFVYIVSEEAAAYASLPADFLSEFATAGLDFSVKIEALA